MLSKQFQLVAKEMRRVLTILQDNPGDPALECVETDDDSLG